MRRLAFVLISLLFFNHGPLLAFGLENVKKWQLENGLTMIVLEDHSIPNANMYIFWRVGSRNEVPGITGLSHFFEHMMFNGAEKFGPGMFDKVMEANGGANNAYTTEDVTVYTDWFPTSSLEKIFELESDRIAHLNLDDKMVASEREVVASERRTGLENNNYERLSEEVKGIAFRAHSYGWPVIGHESDIKSWTKDDLWAYYKSYYAPNNAVAVVVGDVTEADVKTLAKKYLAGIPRAQSPRTVHTVEPEQVGERRVFVKKAEATSPSLLIGYHVPNSLHEDSTALEMLAGILGDGRTSRLYRRLVTESKIATDVDVQMSDALDPTLFYIYTIGMAGADSQKIEKAIYEEIQKLATSGVSETEVEKLKNKSRIALYRSLETINSKANTIGSAEVFYGDYREIMKRHERYQNLTPKSVQDAAKKYLVKSNRNVGVLDSKEVGI